MSESKNFDKLKRVLLVILILGGIFASWSFGINQFSALLENGHAALERDALARCVEYQVPHALVADGVAYCYMIYRGNEKMIPLETLERLYNQPDSPNTSS